VFYPLLSKTKGSLSGEAGQLFSPYGLVAQTVLGDSFPLSSALSLFAWTNPTFFCGTPLSMLLHDFGPNPEGFCVKTA